jgi:hypothetical protein
VEAVFANHDYEPAANDRDDAVRRTLAADSRVLLTFKDQVIFERDEILTGQGRPFSVFTPYKNAWLRTVQPFDLRPYPIRKHLEALAPVPQRYRGQLPTLADLGFTATNLAGSPCPRAATAPTRCSTNSCPALATTAVGAIFRRAGAKLSLGSPALRHDLDPHARPRRA